MPDISNINLNELVKFTIAFHLGSLIFFSAIIAPTTFITLKESNARKFVRAVFPKLYLWSIILNLFIFFLIVLYFNFHFLSLFSGLVLLGYVYSRQVLMPKINQSSDQKNVQSNSKRFRNLHNLSVLIFICQKIMLFIIYVKI